MYEPKQLPYLMNQEFKENIEYKEYKLLELADFCMCIWTMTSKKRGPKTIYNSILPDACIDIVINFTKKNIRFAGFSRETISFPLEEKIDYMGVRLKPSSFYVLFGVEASKVMDNPIPFQEVDTSFDLEKILEVEDKRKRIFILKTYLQTKIKKDSNHKFIEVVDELYQNPKVQTVSCIAKRFGYARRHLYRIFKKYYGVSPQVLLNIVRLHLCLTLLLEGEKMSTIMEICGFYDQAHFIKEIKRYTGFSPLELVQKYQD